MQSQQVTDPVTQQPPAYQVVLMTQGFAQVPFSRQCSRQQGGPGNAQTVPWPADTGLARVAVPAATPMSVPNATSAPRPNNPRRVVLRASPSLILRKSDTIISNGDYNMSSLEVSHSGLLHVLHTEWTCWPL